MISEPTIEKERALEASIAALGSVVVAYSGGVDSSLVAYHARRILGDRATIAIAVSPSLAADELAAARAQARSFAWDLKEVHTGEVELPEYRRNDAQRCYFCKRTLFETLDRLAAELPAAYVAYGANADDLKDFRPGHRAAGEHGVVSPLTDAGLTKDEIRQLARRVGLPSWDRPQAACLASRIPTDIAVTIEALSQVERAEAVLRRLGFRQVRVRHHETLARIEVGEGELARFAGEPELMGEVAAELKTLGYTYVTLDLQGYRQGSVNALAGGRAGNSLKEKEPLENG